MEKKITVAVICGGRSPEHNISLLSASSVIKHIDRNKYNVVVIGITKDGTWMYHGQDLNVNNPLDANKITLISDDKPKVILSQNYGSKHIINAETNHTIACVDVIFPVLHGEYGEDGSIQGLAKIAGRPCVGCGILGSSICMDKDVAKRLLRDSDIRVADFITLRKSDSDQPSYDEIVHKLGKTLFIKPVNLGSSVGVSCVKNNEEYNQALEEAFSYDDKVIVEELLIGREIECAVMGNYDIKASPMGEIVPKSGIYTFESKYVDDDGAALNIPADLPSSISEKARKLAVETFKILDCRGLARVDMFYITDGELVINEVNTMPGFTNISMYPKLWMEAGLSYKEVISNLIELSRS